MRYEHCRMLTAADPFNLLTSRHACYTKLSVSVALLIAYHMFWALRDKTIFNAKGSVVQGKYFHISSYICVLHFPSNMLITFTFSVCFLITHEWLHCVFFLRFFYFFRISFCWWNCHFDLWQRERINHLDLTSLLNQNHPVHFLLIRRWFYKVCCCFAVKVQMQCRWIETKNFEKKNTHTILMAAKCLISVHKSNWEKRTKMHVWMIWQCL